MLKLLLVFIICLNAHANWSPETKKQFNSLQDLVSYKNKDFITLWGSLRRYAWSNSLKGDTFKVKLPQMKNELELYSFKAEGVKPLVIFFPGIFGSHEGDINHWNANDFEKSNLHVGMVPNFLNKNYISAIPKYTKENALSIDVANNLDAIEEIIDHIGVKNINKIVFVAESLGTFIASSSIRFQESYPRIFSRLDKVLLLWPPLDIKNSLSAFDKKFKYTTKAHEDCSYILKLPKFVKHFFWQDHPENVSSEDAHCFSAYLFHSGFKSGLRKSFDAIKETREEPNEQEPENFTEFINAHNPNFLSTINKDPKKVKLSYWLKKWEGNGVKIKILSSEDDFINRPSDWNQVEGEYLFSWGGHCAPLSLINVQKAITKEVQ